MSPEHAGARPSASSYDTAYHHPVLCNAVVDALITDPRGVYVDGTLGGGGHTAALLDALDEEGRVLGLDRDPEAIEEASNRLADQQESGRLTLIRTDFADLEGVLDEAGIERIDGLLLDLGVSSHQLDEAARGFSFRGKGPLDMRMDPTQDESAARWVNEVPEEELRDILYTLGEVNAGRRIARAICGARPMETTADLARAVASVVPSREESKILAQVFQAIRIAVNRELAQLEQILEAGTRRIRSGGRMAVISYHSLEDRRVKRFLRFGNLEGKAQRDLLGNLLTPWSPLTRKAVAASEAEIARNPRARSARLRVAERTDLRLQS